MAPPSQLKIHMGALSRLVKEEASYRQELVDGEEDLKKREDKFRIEGPGEDGNAEFMIKQLRTSVEQTKGVFEPLRKKIAATMEKLGDLLDAAEKNGDVSEEELESARAALANAKTAMDKSA